MRANMEYQRGNSRKAIKLLQNIKPELLALDPLGASLLANNLGCAHLLTGKPELAMHYLSSAWSSHEKELAQENVKSKAAYKHLVRKPEMAYNVAMALLHRGQPGAAFQAFSALARQVGDYHANPHLWMHLAECCIQTNVSAEEDFKEMTAASDSGSSSGRPEVDLCVRTVSSGEHKKIITQPTSVTSAKADASQSPGLTLNYASFCLQRAAYLASRWQRGMDDQQQGQSLPPNQKIPSVTTPLTTRMTSLRAAIALKQAYVNLRLDSHAEALRHAREVIDVAASSTSNAVPQGMVTLAKAYAGEALTFLDRISEAAELLDPRALPPDCTSMDSIREEANGGNNGPVSASGASRLPVGMQQAASSPKRDPSTAGAAAACKSIFTYNLALAHGVREEYDRSLDMLSGLWREHCKRSGQQTKGGRQPGGQQGQGQQALPAGVATRLLSALVHLHLKRGAKLEARSLIKEHCSFQDQHRSSS